MTHTQFINLVSRLRDAQKRHAAARCSQPQLIGKIGDEVESLTKQVDAEIIRFKTAGQPAQSELFK